MKGKSGIPPMEDYGTSDVDDVRTPDSDGETAFDQPEEAYAGGTTGTTPGSGAGEEFGEFDNTSTGTDLTKQMDSTKAKVDADLDQK